MANSFIFISPASRGLALAITRHYLRRTSLPVYATHRDRDPNTIRERMLSGLSVDSTRLTLLPLELTSGKSISDASDSLANLLPSGAHLHTAWITGGIMHPERRPQDINYESTLNMFKVNVISHLLMIKHFSRFLPEFGGDNSRPSEMSRWVHVSAPIASIADNIRGGWYSYRSSKAALSQVIKTFDLQLQMQKKRGATIAIGVHPGIVKTDLSRDFWNSTSELMEPDEAAEKLVKLVDNMSEDKRGKIWSYTGKEMPW